MANVLVALETNLTAELVSLIDSRLSKLAAECPDAEAADSFGYYDSMEHLTGLGFVTCQTYMTAVYGILGVEKPYALSLGPLHSSNTPVASIVNAAANYWKHNNEWTVDKSSRQHRAIENIFEGIGFPVGTEYPLSGVLTELSEPDGVSFSSVMDRLSEWCDEVHRAA